MERAKPSANRAPLQQEEIMRVSPDFFTTLGVNPAIGRTFTEEETIAPAEERRSS